MTSNSEDEKAQGRFEGEVLTRLRGIESSVDHNKTAHDQIWKVVRNMDRRIIDLTWKQKGISALIALGVSVAAWIGQFLVLYIMKNG